jgi:cytoskeletal protein RodZ
VTIGSELRQAREQRGVSLRELSERTNIRQAVLRAIEADDFNRLPRGVIMRGFLKLYAREVGLDPDEIGQRYAALLESTGADRASEGGDSANQDHAGHTPIPQAGPRFASVRVVVAGAAIALLVVVGFLALRPTRDPGPRADGEDQPPATAPATVSQPSAPTAKPPRSEAATKPGAAPATRPEAVPATRPADTRPDPVAASGAGLRIDIQATGPCWISATADGRQVAYRQVDAGDRLAIPATGEVVLRIGMPANVAVSINGRPVRPFDRPGTPVTLRITPGNYRDLVSP